MKTIGLLKEANELESRVSLIPSTIIELIKTGKFSFVVQENAGVKSGFSNEDYVKAGAKLVSNCAEIIKLSDIILSISSLPASEITCDSAKKTFVALFEPYENKQELAAYYTKKASVFSLELIPRISRAQSMDVLSSQANIAGYVAMLMAAHRLNKVIPMMMTAAGTIKPAKVLVLGAGVAGLSAISTAKRLGAVVFAYDVRSAVKEQIQSLGAKFVELALNIQNAQSEGGYARALSQEEQNAQRAQLTQKAKEMDVIITTAQIPGKKAPLLLDEEIFSLMKNNSVIIDMAAKSGGNVAHVAKPCEWEKIKNVWLFAGDNLSSHMAQDASLTFSNNMKTLLLEVFSRDILDLSDEIVQSALICHDGAWISKQILLS